MAQSFLLPSDTLNKKRRNLIYTTEATTYVGSQVGLYFAWYTAYREEKFHFFNDWPGWQQMDKAGHFVTNHQLCWDVYKFQRWSGVSEKKSMLFGAGLGTSYQFLIEIMDGYSAGWGFSWGDIASNTLGGATFLSQQWFWHEQRIQLKYSFTPINYNKYNDIEQRRLRNLYGSTIFEQWLKDYNAQTYWVSANVWSLIGKPDHFPKWLNIAAGYSSNNLFGAERNWWYNPDNPDEILSSSRIRERQYLLSLDIDFQKVNLPKKLLWMRPIFGLIKIPFPAIELNNVRGLKGHWIYF